MLSEESIYCKENLIDTKEHLSPSKRYKLVIETYKTGPKTWNYTKGILYEGDAFIGSIERNYSHFPYFFFVKGDKEYLVSGSSYMAQTILDCSTGQKYDNTNDSDGFCWSQMFQVDENTICVLGCFWGGPYMYRFYDFSCFSKGWPDLKPIGMDGGDIPKYDYILMNNDLAGEKNYPDPVITNGEICFQVKDTRICGIATWTNFKTKEKDIDRLRFIDIDKREHKYLPYYEEEGYWIEKEERKEYQNDMAEMRFKRERGTRERGTSEGGTSEGDKMVMTYFWRSEEQIERDKEQGTSEQGTSEQEFL